MKHKQRYLKINALADRKPMKGFKIRSDENDVCHAGIKEDRTMIIEKNVFLMNNASLKNNY
jgi:hypothetical protein